MRQKTKAPQRIAYGCSKLLYFYLTHTQDRDFAFIVDKAYSGKQFCGIDVITPDEFVARHDGDMHVFVFAVSNGALDSILCFLAKHNFRLGRNASLYSELFASSFELSLQSDLGWTADRRLLQFSMVSRQQSPSCLRATSSIQQQFSMPQRIHRGTNS